MKSSKLATTMLSLTIIVNLGALSPSFLIQRAQGATSTSTTAPSPPKGIKFHANETYLYKSCKTSLADGSFEHSYCAGVIGGYVIGHTMALFAIPVHNPADLCGDAKNQVLWKLQHVTCLPETVSYKDIAKHYLQYIDSGQAGEDISSDEATASIAYLAETMSMYYSCNKK